MKLEPCGPAVRRLTVLIASTLLLMTASQSLFAADCDCGCSRYAQLLLSLNEVGNREQDQFLEHCAGACAIAWANCEARHAHDDSWPPLASETDSEASELADDERPVARSGEYEDTIYLP